MIQPDPDLLLQSGALLEFVAGLIVGAIAMRLLLRAFSPSEARRLRGGPQRALHRTGGTGTTGATRASSAPSLPRLLGALGKGLLAALVEANRRSQQRRGLSSGPRDLPRGFVEAEARRMVATGAVTDAIAFVRQATDMGLAEAREYVTRLKR